MHPLTLSGTDIASRCQDWLKRAQVGSDLPTHLLRHPGADKATWIPGGGPLDAPAAIIPVEPIDLSQAVEMTQQPTATAAIPIEPVQIAQLDKEDPPDADQVPIPPIAAGEEDGLGAAPPPPASGDEAEEEDDSMEAPPPPDTYDGEGEEDDGIEAMSNASGSTGPPPSPPKFEPDDDADSEDDVGVENVRLPDVSTHACPQTLLCRLQNAAF